jgi:hypothetical protein
MAQFCRWVAMLQRNVLLPSSVFVYPDDGKGGSYAMWVPILQAAVQTVIFRRP